MSTLGHNVDDVSYVHECSTLDQVQRAGRVIYIDHPDTFVVRIPLDELKERYFDVRVEVLTPRSEEIPHNYGGLLPLELMQAVDQHHRTVVRQEGNAEPQDLLDKNCLVGSKSLGRR